MEAKICKGLLQRYVSEQNHSLLRKIAQVPQEKKPSRRGSLSLSPVIILLKIRYVVHFPRFVNILVDVALRRRENDGRVSPRAGFHCANEAIELGLDASCKAQYQ